MPLVYAGLVKAQTHMQQLHLVSCYVIASKVKHWKLTGLYSLQMLCLCSAFNSGMFFTCE